MSDSILYAFLRRTREEAAAINAASDTVRLVARREDGTDPSFRLEAPAGDDALGPQAMLDLRDPSALPDTYDGRLRGVEHLVRTAQGTVTVSSEDLPFTIHFPSAYLRSTDPRLPFEVVRVGCPLVHPNVRGHLVCLGEHFRPGTSLKPLVTQVYRMFSGRSFATAHPFDLQACLYYLAHLDQVSALVATPLWRRPLVAR